MHRRCYRILGFAFVDEPVAKCAVGLNKALNGFASIVVDQAFESFATFCYGCSYDEDKRLMITQEIFFDDDVGMRNFFRLQLTQPFTVAALIQELAVKRTGDGFFALFAATLRADVCLQPWTESLRSASAANRTFLRHLF